MELVSVIIPTHNGSINICRAVDSVLSQDYQNIEVIIVDDNGIGTSEQIRTEENIKKYKNNSNVHYIKHEKNINGSAARNSGFRASKGKYIALLDDDDIFLPHKISMQMKRMKEKGKEYGICYTSYENIFYDGRRRVIKSEKEGNLCFDLLAMNIEVLSSVLLISREAWLDIGGFDESFKRDQDQEFCVRLFDKYKVALVEDVCMVRYVLKRNVPVNVDIAVKYREYYIEKMKNIIDKFDSEKKKIIYSAQYISIAKRYLKSKNFKKCLKYLFKSKTPIKGILSLNKDFISYRKSLKQNYI